MSKLIERMAEIGKYDYYGQKIPGHMHSGLAAYIEMGQPTGDFLRCVLSNDLSGACIHADNKNIKVLPAYVGYLYNKTPLLSHGSKERFELWIESKGLAGLKIRADKEEAVING